MTSVKLTSPKKFLIFGLMKMPSLGVPQFLSIWIHCHPFSWFHKILHISKIYMKRNLENVQKTQKKSISISKMKLCFSLKPCRLVLSNKCWTTEEKMFFSENISWIYNIFHWKLYTATILILKWIKIWKYTVKSIKTYPLWLCDLEFITANRWV